MTLNQEEMEKLADVIIGKLMSDKCGLMHMFLATQKMVDDALMRMRLEDVAEIEKISLTGPPSRYQPNPTAQGAGNRVIFYAYKFVPMDAEEGRKYPLIVFPHGGVHASFGTGASNVVRELVQQGYIVVAPDYRGSTGYGKEFYELIDYGGLETEDTLAARDFMVANCELVDPERVGIIGWSHGGLHTVWNVIKNPESYKVAYACVPVSNLVARMGYKTDQYRTIFGAPSHIGKSAFDNVGEYKNRSPSYYIFNNSVKLRVPLLVHTTQNDQDVNVLEVEDLIKALLAAGNVPERDFWYRIYPPTPGAHAFNRLDEGFSKGVRGEVYEFLARYLSPPKPNPLKKFIGSPNPLEAKKD